MNAVIYPFSMVHNNMSIHLYKDQICQCCFYQVFYVYFIRLFCDMTYLCDGRTCDLLDNVYV